MANGCELVSQGGGRYALRGDLGFENVTELLEESRAPFAREQRIEIDLSGLKSSDSAALALLIEWLRLARVRNVPIAYRGLPDQLIALADISDLDELFEEADPDRGTATTDRSVS